jgi:prefoldin subunit 5
MGLPWLKVPEDLVEPRLQPGPLEVIEEIAEIEEKIERTEARVRQLRRSLEELVSAAQALLAQISEEDVIAAFEQVAVEEARHRPAFLEDLEEWCRLRTRVEERPNSPLRTRALQLLDRQIHELQSALDVFEWGKGQLETLRDAVLVREAQELSAPAFWGGDEE